MDFLDLGKADSFAGESFDAYAQREVIPFNTLCIFLPPPFSFTLSHLPLFFNLHMTSPKSCNTINCTLDSINYLNATLDCCTYGRVIPSAIRNLETAVITQGGTTDDECRQNRNAVFRVLDADREAV